MLKPHRRLALLILSGVVVASSACAVDGTTAPGLAPAEASYGKTVKVVVSPTDSTEYVFTVDPTRSNLLSMGPHQLSIPAGGICDLATSGYGPTMWDASCVSQRSAVVITAKVKGGAGSLPRIDFEPALRFSPNTQVLLTMYVKKARQNNATAWRVLYCATSKESECYDESLADPSLQTYMFSGNNWVQRRVKHFSGYLVAE